MLKSCICIGSCKNQLKYTKITQYLLDSRELPLIIYFLALKKKQYLRALKHTYTKVNKTT